METHAHEQVHWQTPRASVAITEFQTLYSSTPHWSWWVGHGIFGATLGLLSSVLLEKQGRLAR